MTRHSRWRRAGLVCCGLALGCGGDDPPAPVVEPVITAPATGPYEVHEWGLIAASTAAESARAVTSPLTVGGGILGQLGNGGGVLHGTGGIGKPVLYFHLDEGTDALDLSVSLRATGGQVLEHFPAGVLSEENAALRWPSVRVTRGACRGTYPALTDPACRTSDGLCEAAEVAAYESATADCVQVGEQRGGVLLYRTGPSTARLPLAVTVDAVGQVSVRRAAPLVEGQLPREVGWVMRITRGDSRALTRVQVVRLGADGTGVVPVVAEGGAGADVGHAHLRDALGEAGLDDAERDAFLTAWNDALFGEAEAAPAGGGYGTLQVPGGSAIPPGGAGYAPTNPRMPRPHPGEGEAGLVGTLGGNRALGFHHALGSVADALVYLVPEADVDALLPLTLEPEPGMVRRVFLARVEIVAPRVRLVVAPVSVEGGLSVDVARRVLRRHAFSLGNCLSITGPSGTLTVELRILTTGAVERATIRGLALDAEQNTCFVQHLRSMRFPENDAVTQLTAPITVSR